MALLMTLAIHGNDEPFDLGLGFGPCSPVCTAKAGGLESLLPAVLVGESVRGRDISLPGRERALEICEDLEPMAKALVLQRPRSGGRG